MKKTLKSRMAVILLSVMLCYAFSAPSFAAAVEVANEAPVGVIVEYVEEDELMLPDASAGVSQAAETVVDLSKGSVNFSVGALAAGSSYNSSVYSITESTIKVGLQSLTKASSHIRVTLYRTSVQSVAVSTITIPVSSAINPITTYVTFTNLDTRYTYDFVIENIDSESSGVITGIVKQE